MVWGAFMRGVRGMAGPARAGASEYAQTAGRWARSAWGNSAGRGAIIGGGAGAAWGMASDDTSVLGGMAMGAGLGAGVGRYGTAGYKMWGSKYGQSLGTGARLSAGGQQAWSAARGDMSAAWNWATGGAGVAAGKAAASKVSAQARAAGTSIGNTMSKAPNAIKGLGNSVAGMGFSGGQNLGTMTADVAQSARSVASGLSQRAAARARMMRPSLERARSALYNLGR